MKPLTTIATATIIFASGARAQTQKLSDADRTFVTALSATAVIVTECSNAKVIQGGLGKLADRVGIDGDSLRKATSAANRGQY